MIKQIIKKVLPKILLNKWRNFISIKRLKAAYNYDMKRYIKFSDNYSHDSKIKLIGLIIREYHVVEKGLTMPDTRYGFGKDLIIDLIKHCFEYIKLYGKNEIQLVHAIKVILEYEEFHSKQNFVLDTELKNLINKLKGYNIQPSLQIEMNKTDYFKDINNSFPLFSDSRSSIRNFSEEVISIENILKSLEIAKNAPSACNRQCWRTYIFSNKSNINEILNIQGGNRGFGHLTNKLIVITAEIGGFANLEERNAAYVDGGIYTMNLLYSLHFNKIAACILNCSNGIDKDVLMRKVCGIKESEVFIAMISCGIPPEKFKIAFSERYNVEYTNTIM
jgi:nitroreductase